MQNDEESYGVPIESQAIEVDDWQSERRQKDNPRGDLNRWEFLEQRHLVDTEGR